MFTKRVRETTQQHNANDAWVESAKRYGLRLQEQANTTLQSIQALHGAVSSAGFDDPRVAGILKAIEDALFEEIGHLAGTLRDLLPEVEWTRFNIGFFGETTAGKSTIIEALTRGDGARIGDGSLDFTRDKAEIAMHDVAGVHLIDMPGIEGDEDRVQQAVRAAVARCHVIYYVYRGKIPETGTLEKIRHYLRDNARVYSVLNARGTASAYRDARSLLDRNEKTIPAADRVFTATLGQQYASAFALNACLAFSARGRPVHPALRKEQQKAIEIFGDSDTLAAFSNIEALERHIRLLSATGGREVIVSNTNKILSMHQDLMRRVLQQKKGFDQVVRALGEEAKDTKDGIDTVFNTCESNIKRFITVKLEQLRGQAKLKVQHLLDRDYPQHELEKAIKELVEKKNHEIKHYVKSEVDELQKQVALLVAQCQTRLTVRLNVRAPDGSIDLSVIVNELNIGIGYVTEKAAGVAASVAGVVTAALINPILGAVTAVVAVIKHLLDWFRNDPRERRARAKAKVIPQIDVIIDKLQADSLKNLRKDIAETRRSLGSKLTELRLIAERIKRLGKTMNAGLQEIQEQTLRIGTALIQIVGETGVSHAYIDLELQQACVLGSITETKKTADILRLHRIVAFEGPEAFLKELRHEREGDMLVATDHRELMLRAAGALHKQLGFQSMRRKRKHGD